MNIGGDVLESTAVLYGTRQDRFKTLDVGLVELTTGPRFQLGDSGLGKATLRPYLLANLVALGDVRYYHTFGTGIGFTQEIGSRVLGEVLFERREKHFKNSGQRPFATEQTGDENSVFVSTRIQTSGDTLLSLGVGVSDNDAREIYRSYSQYLGAASFTYFFDPEFWPVTQPWAITASISRLVTNYDGPEPVVDPDITRRDREWRFGLLGSVPLTDSLAVIAQAQRFNVDSNLPNFEFENWSFTGGLTWRF
jgi:hypothetical protein